MARNVKEVRRPRRGVLVETPPWAPPGSYAWLHRRADGDFHLSLWGADGKLLPGNCPPDTGRPVSVWPECRSRPAGDAVAAIAKAKLLQARRWARMPVEPAGEPWVPPAMPEPRLPDTWRGERRLIAKLVRERERRELIFMTDPLPEMPRVVPNSTPVSVGEGMRILEARFQVALAEAREERLMAVLREQWPALSDDVLRRLEPPTTS